MLDARPTVFTRVTKTCINAPFTPGAVKARLAQTLEGICSVGFNHGAGAAILTCVVLARVDKGMAAFASIIWQTLAFKVVDEVFTSSSVLAGSVLTVIPVVLA